MNSCQLDRKEEHVIIYRVVKTQRGVRMKQEMNYVEVVANLITVIDGEVKILLCRNKRDPYKGYWILPSQLVKQDMMIEEALALCITKKAKLPVIEMKQVGVFGALERKVNKRVIGISYLGLIDSVSIALKQVEHSLDDLNWFPINKLPKLGFDHEQIIPETIVQLRTMLRDYHILEYLFPSDFSLPEMQRACEMILDHPLDRRNFRKKFMQHDLIEETGDQTEGMSGRPAKLYRFKEPFELHY